MTNWLSLAIDPTLQPGAEVVFVGEGATPIGRDACLERAANAARSTGFQPRPGMWLDIVGDAPGARLVLLGLQDEKEGGHDRWLNAGGDVVEAMRALRIETVRLPTAEDLGGDAALGSVLLGALLHGFRLDQQRSGGAQRFEPRALVIDEGDRACADAATRTAHPINRARAWTEQPANLLTPEAFAKEAADALETCGAAVRTLHLPELEALGMGGLLAVGRASEHEPKLLVAEWRGAPDRAGWDAAMVGKGVTFDAGGLNIKSRPVIEKMKFDMGGAAAVLGAIELAVSRRARVNVVAVVPMAENVIGGRGVRPGDVIRSLAGLTVEVTNTDAEGRLLLADGITYAIDHYKPTAIVDVATLTGAITGVLHEEFAGVYASDELLAAGLLRAGEATGELLWRLPLVAEQDYLVDSSVADVANVGASGFLGLGYGSPAAGAKFVQRFTRGLPWAHIDIAGTAWATRRTPRAQPGATGFGVALLDHWLAGLESGGERQAGATPL